MERTQKIEEAWAWARSTRRNMIRRKREQLASPNNPFEARPGQEEAFEKNMAAIFALDTILEEAAAFERIKYNTLIQRMKRNPTQYETKTQAREGGGKDQVLISVTSLTAKARKAWRATQKIDGRDVIIDRRAAEAVPWYVTVDLNHYIEGHRKAYYEAVEAARVVQEFIDYTGPEKRTGAEPCSAIQCGGHAAPFLTKCSAADEF